MVKSLEQIQLSVPGDVKYNLRLPVCKLNSVNLANQCIRNVQNSLLLLVNLLTAYIDKVDTHYKNGNTRSLVVMLKDAEQKQT